MQLELICQKLVFVLRPNCLDLFPVEEYLVNVAVDGERPARGLTPLAVQLHLVVLLDALLDRLGLHLLADGLPVLAEAFDQVAPILFLFGRPISPD